MNEFQKYGELNRHIHAPDALKEKVLTAAAAEIKKKQHKSFRGGLRLIQQAAVIAIIAALLPLTVYAVVQLFGLQEYLASEGFEDTGAAQELSCGPLNDISYQNNYGSYTIMEAICDSEIIYLAARVTPVSEDTFLVPEHVMPEDNASNLSIEGITEGTVADYAASIGKKLTYVSLGFAIEGVRLDTTEAFCYGDDGALYFYYSAQNPSSSKNITLTCAGSGVDETLRIDRLDRVEFEVKLFDRSSSLEYMYYDIDSRAAADTGIEIHRVSITETELCLYATIQFSCDADWLDHLSFKLENQAGELKHMPGFHGDGIAENEDGTYSAMVAYQKSTSISDITLVIHDYVQNKDYGPYTFE